MQVILRKPRLKQKKLTIIKKERKITVRVNRGKSIYERPKIVDRIWALTTDSKLNISLSKVNYFFRRQKRVPKRSAISSEPTPINNLYY